MTKTLSSYCNRYTYEYILHSDLLYFEISNSSKKQCLRIDTRHVNHLRPAKFRTGAENDKQNDRAFNGFLAVRKQTSTDAIVFSIVSLINKSSNHEDTYFKVSQALREFNKISNKPEQRIQRVSQSDPDRGTNDRRQQQQQQQQQQKRPDQQQNNGRKRVSKKP